MPRPSAPQLDPSELAAAIKAVRERQNLSQEQLAHQLGVSTRTVARWEGGESAPRANILAALGLGAGAAGQGSVSGAAGVATSLSGAGASAGVALGSSLIGGSGLLNAFGLVAAGVMKAGTELRTTRQRAALRAVVDAVAKTHRLPADALAASARAVLAEMIDSGVTDLRELLGLLDEL